MRKRCPKPPCDWYVKQSKVLLQLKVGKFWTWIAVEYSPHKKLFSFEFLFWDHRVTRGRASSGFVDIFDILYMPRSKWNAASGLQGEQSQSVGRKKPVFSGRFEREKFVVR